MKYWGVRAISIVLAVLGCFALDGFVKSGSNPELLIRPGGLLGSSKVEKV